MHLQGCSRPEFVIPCCGENWHVNVHSLTCACMQIVLLGTGRYLLGFILPSREIELMDNPIPQKLYPECVKRMKGESMVYQKNNTPEVELAPLIIPERS